MMDRQDFAIGVLSITGVILLVAVILTTFGLPQPAHAIGQSDRGGDYLMVTAQFTESAEVVCVTDAAANRMNVYSFDWNRGQIQLWDRFDLERTLGGAAGRPGRMDQKDHNDRKGD